MKPDEQLRDEYGAIIFGTDGEPMTSQERDEEYERWERDYAPEDYWRHKALKWEKLHDARTAELSSVTADKDAEIERLLAELATAKQDADSWHRSFDAQASEIKRLSDERDDLDDAIERLAEIGRAVGCGHYDSSDGRSQLLNCVTQTLAAAEEIAARMRANNSELLAALKECITVGLDEGHIDDKHPDGHSTGGNSTKQERKAANARRIAEAAIAQAETGKEGGE